MGEDLHFLGLETGFLQFVGKLPVGAGRPDRQHAFWPQGLGAGTQAASGVEPAVGSLGQAFGAIVDVEHDRVEALRLGLQHFGHVFQADHRARVQERVSGLLAQRPTVPFHDAGDQLGNHHFSVLAQVLERRGEGETHAQSTDQHPRIRPTGDLAAGDLGQGIFGTVHARVHQLPAVAALDLDDEILAVLEQAKGTAVFGNRGGIEQNETFHGAHLKKIGSTGEGKRTQLGVACK
ncbi:hypothetical protein D3C73_1143580 [compost metagenome]